MNVTELSQQAELPAEVQNQLGEQTLGADLATRNVSFRDSISYGASAYLLSPRMWPFGYILNSSYSPLQLEREMPSPRWRDAFEDLLAVDSGQGLIASKTRKEENRLCRQLLLKTVRTSIHEINDDLAFGQKWHERFSRLHAKNPNLVEEGLISTITKIQDDLASQGKLATDQGRIIASEPEAVDDIGSIL